MDKQEKPTKKFYQKWWVWVIGIFLLFSLRLRANNIISLLILIIGIVGLIFSGSLLRKMLTEKNTDGQTVDKVKIKYTSIVLSVCLIMTVTGYCTLSFDGFQRSEKEQVIKNVIFNGADENGVPLSISDLKLLKKGDTYTLLGTLKKTSTEPEQSYFKFDVAMIDKNGKHIKEETVDTMPYPSFGRENMPLFKYGTSSHLEKEIYISSSDPTPVNIEITNIREFDKASFIKVILEDTKKNMSKGYNDAAKSLLDKIFEYEPDNAEAKALLEQLSDPNHTPTPSTAPTPKPEKNVLIGTGKENVRRLLSKYKETKSIMSSNALDFEDNNLLITVYFNSDDIADGVLFMQNSFEGVDTLTGVGSYVSKHYDELVKLATDDPNVKIESDLTLYNSKGVKKEAMELYIGNIPNNNSKSTTSQNQSDGANAQTQSNNTTTKQKSEFSQCLSSGIVVGVKLYATPNNDSYVGTITSLSNDILDERGKKTKAVYISGGKADGWYKRSEIGQLYVRNDDPCLPSGRYVAESMGAD